MASPKARVEGAVKKIKKHMLQLEKIIQSLVKKSSSVKQQRHEVGHVFVYFCVISGHKKQQKQKTNCGCSKRLDLCNSWWVGDVC